MVYNNWNDPEDEMIQAAILDFIDKIEEGEIEDLAFRKDDGGMGYNDDLRRLFNEMLEEYDIEECENTYLDFCEKLEDKLGFWLINHI